jgi:hypothetical protein
MSVFAIRIEHALMVGLQEPVKPPRVEFVGDNLEGSTQWTGTELKGTGKRQKVK